MTQDRKLNKGQIMEPSDIEKLVSGSGLTPEEIEKAVKNAADVKKRAEEIYEHKQKYYDDLTKEDPNTITFNQWKSFFAKRYLELNKRPLDVDKDNEDVVTFLLLYFAGAQDLIEKYGEVFSLGGKQQEMSIDKGVLVLGSTGTGKTSIMKTLTNNPVKPFGVVSAIDVSQKFHKAGYDAIDMYQHLNKNPSVRPFNHNVLGWCFDDMGAERVTKHFGDESKIMEEILFRHSNEPESRGKIHGSSNLELPQLQEWYGPRIYSRIFQMFNIIFYKSEKDRRR